MMCNSENKLSNFVGGLVMGGIIGAVITALTTPFSGQEAQHEVLNAYNTGVQGTKDSFNDLSHDAKDKAQGILNNIKDKAYDVAVRFEELANKGAGVLIEDEIV